VIFSSLRVSGFRNLADAEIDISGKDVYLVGENGQGKTNFLEALYFCAYASSFRGAADKELVRNGEKSCAAHACFVDSLHNEVLVKIDHGRKSVTLDGKRLEDRRDLLSVVPCIVFCHEDMDFVAGTPEQRRWFFDQSQTLYAPLYLDDLRKYRKLLKTRNALLREHEQNGNIKAMLDALDPQLAWYGLRLMEKRAEAAECFSAIFTQLFAEVSGIDHITVRYSPSWKAQSEERVLSSLHDKLDADLNSGVTLTGPHRDRYRFFREGAEFSTQASTGQRRLLALLLRVAQARRFRDITGKNPVLLLDDVLLELDGEKRRRFLEVMPEYDQAFYTFLPEEPYSRYRKADTLVYTMRDGALQVQSEDSR
jgi:DNA replication and repair protein RecF